MSLPPSPASSWFAIEIETNKKNTVSNIKLINERTSIKEFRGTGNLNGANEGGLWLNLHQALRCGQK